MTQSPSPDPAAQRVYIVDDEWIIAETLATILTRHGFQAYPFHSPNRAFVRAMDQPPDVLLTDVMMPDLSGIELAIALRRAGNNCRVLLFSGEACAVDLLCDARRRGYDFELLDKPLHPMQLLLRLRNSKRPSRRHLAESDEPSISPGPDLIVDPGSDPTSGSIPAA